MADRVGQQFGNYLLVSLLGQGGYAEVYLGQHVRLELQVAIKVLHTYLTGSEAEHFQQEAQTIAKLTHPAIIRILDYDVQEGVPFLVMDYAPNGSLRRRYPKGSVVPLTQIASYAKQVAAALQYAHEQKFIHRDVKPENMLVGRQQEVLLSDFGLAALAHSTGSLSAQEAVGTLPYMAPEQIEGHPRAASDQYALGVVVYEWLCGERPFEGSVTEIIVKHLSMPPPPLRERVPTISLEVEQAVLRALAKEPKERFASVQDFATALERASQLASAHPVLLPSEQPTPGSVAASSYATAEATPSAELLVGALEPTVYPSAEAPGDLTTPASQAGDETPLPGQSLEPTVAATPFAAVLPHPLEPTMPVRRKARRLPRINVVLLIGLVVVIIAGGILGSLSLLGARSTPPSATAVRGGTWINDFIEPNSLLPAGPAGYGGIIVDQALYLPLFYGDAQGVIHSGAASEVPRVQNGGISADGTTWTFHLRPHLVWSDGAPYDARDVDYSWQLWANPKFNGGNPGMNLISSAQVSADHLSITFHLKQAYAPFLSYWVDGIQAPLPAHHFSLMAPQAILKSPENLNPQVTSGPFMMEESVPGDHYTLTHNPQYYRAREGLPYLDKVVFRIVADADAILKDLQAGTIDSSSYPLNKVQEYQHLTHYTLTATPTSDDFEAMYFNFHNQVLSSHLEVRQAMAMAIDHQALIEAIPGGLATRLCTDHGSAYHPGFEPNPPCPVFDPAAANKLLDDNGWVRGPDGVRAKGEQRLEFEYSTAVTFSSSRLDIEAIIQRNMQAIGIKLDIQNYPTATFFGPFLSAGKASPPTGAVAGRYDIAEFEDSFGYDPDDSWMLSCDQIPPQGSGSNVDFYCNPALDALYRQEVATADPGVRQQLFVQIHQIYLTQFPFIVLYSPTRFALEHKGTHNYQISPIEGGTSNIWQWWCDQGKC